MAASTRSVANGVNAAALLAQAEAEADGERGNVRLAARVLNQPSSYKHTVSLPFRAMRQTLGTITETDIPGNGLVTPCLVVLTFSEQAARLVPGSSR
jgi:hypothetical protein